MIRLVAMGRRMKTAEILTEPRYNFLTSAAAALLRCSDRPAHTIIIEVVQFTREVTMRSFVVALALSGCVVCSYAASASAAEPTVACELLTQAQIGTATGATVGAGSPIARPGSCQWAGQGKIVTLTITLPRAGKSPVDQFAEGKTRMIGGVTTEPVSGVGDDAYYVFFTGTTRAGCGLVVKKGSSVFEVRVYGFELAQAKTVSKALAQNAAAKF
jgi:hypothetical protein